MGLKPFLRTTASFSALTLLVGSFDLQKPVPDMTYYVFSGTLNLAESNQLLQTDNHASISSLKWDKSTVRVSTVMVSVRVRVSPQYSPQQRICDHLPIQLVNWSLTSLFSTNMAISETKG